jgi:hypothetical protein
MSGYTYTDNTTDSSTRPLCSAARSAAWSASATTLPCMASQTDTFIGGGVALATIGGVLMGVGATENAGSGHTVWSNPWFDVGCALVACGLVLVVVALIASWRRSRQHDELDDFEGLDEPTIRETVEQGIPLPRGLGRGLGALIPEPPPPPPSSPLDLRLVDESWRLVYGVIWVFGLAIRVTNLTEKPVILTQYWVSPHSGAGPRPPLDPKVWESVNASLKQLKTDHESELFDKEMKEITVPPLGSITRWYVHTSYIPLPDGGRPRCTFGMKDTLDNQYRLEVPARAPETYHS